LHLCQIDVGFIPTATPLQKPADRFLVIGWTDNVHSMLEILNSLCRNGTEVQASQSFTQFRRLTAAVAGASIEPIAGCHSASEIVEARNGDSA
jgi:hypothetical protein